MKKPNNVWRALACGGLSLAMVGLPLSVSAATPSNTGSQQSNQRTEHREDMRAMREKMLAQAKSEDATLQKLDEELKQAPESKKVDIEASILNQLVAQHHQMVTTWESMHERMAQYRREHMTGTQTMSPTGRTAQGGCSHCSRK